MLDKITEGIDVYGDDDGIYFIFTAQKKLILELTKSGLIWYNYNFFNDYFKYISLDVIKTQHYITEWIENKVKHIKDDEGGFLFLIKNIVNNGIKNTVFTYYFSPEYIENIIEYGYKYTDGDIEIVKHERN